MCQSEASRIIQIVCLFCSGSDIKRLKHKLKKKKKKKIPTKQQNPMKFGVAGWEGSDMKNSYYQHKLQCSDRLTTGNMNTVKLSGSASLLKGFKGFQEFKEI